MVWILRKQQGREALPGSGKSVETLKYLGLKRQGKGEVTRKKEKEKRRASSGPQKRDAARPP